MVVVDSSVIALSTHSLTCFVNLSDFMTAGLLKVNKTKTIKNLKWNKLKKKYN